MPIVDTEEIVSFPAIRVGTKEASFARLTTRTQVFPDQTSKLINESIEILWNATKQALLDEYTAQEAKYEEQKQIVKERKEALATASIEAVVDSEVVKP